MNTPAFQTLSIIIPAYNEAKTIHLILERVCAVSLLNGLKKEIVIVNDCSTDSTKEAIESFISSHSQTNIRLFNQPVNKGKGG